MKFTLRIVVTEKCNENCPHCFNAGTRLKGEMDASMLIDFMRASKQYTVRQPYMIMGGEPMLHPRIGDILYEAIKATGVVKLYTNGNSLDALINDSGLLNFHQRGNLFIIFNAYAIDLKKLNSYLKMLNPKYCGFHLVVPMNSDAAYRKIREIISVNQNFTFVISPDTTLDLLNEQTADSYRKTWVNFLTTINHEMKNNFSGMDHRFPFCFYTVEMLQKLAEKNLSDCALGYIGCDGHGMLGLVQTNFDLYHCNQTGIKLGSLLKDNKLVSYEEILKMLLKGSALKKQVIMKNEKCQSCQSLDMCLLGCFSKKVYPNISQ